MDNYFNQFLKTHNPKKILHIGGHFGEEGEMYTKLGVKFTFVEPVKEFAEKIKEKEYPVLEMAVGTFDGEFYVDRGLSSFLKSKEEREIARVEHIKAVPLSKIEKGYDTLVIDTEGTILDVLKSGKLDDAKVIICELRDELIFVDESSKDEVEQYLSSKGFTKVEEHVLDDDPEAYDVFFVRELNFQELARQVPKYYEMHNVYQSVWVGGKEIIKGTRDNMFARLNKINKADIKDKVVVDIGCNLGASSFWAIENGAKECVGFDVAKEGIALANTIAKAYNLNCSFHVQDFGVKIPKRGDIAFCFACHDDISKDGKRDAQLLENLKHYDIVYFETHLKHSFGNWDMPQLIKDNFKCEYLGETGEGSLKRDLYRLTA